MDKQKDSLYLPYRMIIEKITDDKLTITELKFNESLCGNKIEMKVIDNIITKGLNMATQYFLYSLFSYAQRIYRMYFPTSRKSDNRLIQIGNGCHNRFSRTIRQYVSFG